jgi:hypothetical protein
VVVALVTCWLLASVFGGVLNGDRSPVEVLVYGVTSAFGLEFLGSTWTSLRAP